MPSEKTRTVKLEGSLNIQKAGTLHEEFLDESNSRTNLTLDFSSVTDVDFAILQLLYSLNETYLADGKSMEIVNVPPKLKEWFELSDFESLIEGK